jgi:hypothetical protein
MGFVVMGKKRVGFPITGNWLEKWGGDEMSAGVLVLMSVGLALADGPAGELAPPVRLEAAGKAIDTEIGHAAPFVADFDGDGVQDLLVGQFGQGIMRIYRNKGSNARPKLEAGVTFKAGGKEGRVPTG